MRAIYLLVLLCASLSAAAQTPLAPFMSGGAWGCADPEGKVVVPARFSTLLSPSEGRIAAMPNGGKLWGYLDAVSGNWAIQPRFTRAFSYSEGLALVYAPLPQFIDKAGTVVIGPELLKNYSRIGSFTESRCQVCTPNGECGFIDNKGEVAFMPVRDSLFVYHQNRVRALDQLKGLWGYADEKGQYLINSRWVAAGDFYDGRAMVADMADWYIINIYGKTTDTLDIEDARPEDCAEGLVPVQDGSQWGFMNLQGKLVVGTQFEQVKPYSNGLAAVRQDKKWGFVTNEGRWAVKPQFSDDQVRQHHSFRHDRLPVCKAGECGWIDRTGRWIPMPGATQTGDFGR